MSEERRAVTPIRPAAAYIGGKRRLGELLARRIEAVPHETYAEPFVSMGGVFFRRRWAPRREVINDISRDVATLFRILQRHYPQFMETLKFQITSRAEFERLAASNADTLTDLDWAGRFLDLQRLAFGGKVAGRNFGIETAGASRFDVTKLGLEEIHSRRRRDRVSAVAGVHRPLRHGQDAVISIRPIGARKTTTAPASSPAPSSSAWPRGWGGSQASSSCRSTMCPRPARSFAASRSTRSRHATPCPANGPT